MSVVSTYCNKYSNWYVIQGAVSHKMFRCKGRRMRRRSQSSSPCNHWTGDFSITTRYCLTRMRNAELEDQFSYFRCDGDAPQFSTGPMWSKDLHNWTTGNSPTFPLTPTMWLPLQTRRRWMLGPPPSLSTQSVLWVWKILLPLFCLIISHTSLIDERWLKIFATPVIER